MWIHYEFVCAKKNTNANDPVLSKICAFYWTHEYIHLGFAYIVILHSKALLDFKSIVSLVFLFLDEILKYQMSNGRGKINNNNSFGFGCGVVSHSRFHTHTRRERERANRFYFGCFHSDFRPITYIENSEIPTRNWSKASVRNNKSISK